MRKGRLLVYKIVSYFFAEEKGCTVRNAILKWAGATIGKNVCISPRAIIEGTGHLIIEDNVFIGPGTLVTANGNSTVYIKKNTQIAHFVSLKTTTHQISTIIKWDGIGYNGGGIAGKPKYLDIVIGEGCWLCAGCIILPGVTVENYSICAAGAVVTTNVPSCCMVAGVPAVVKKKYPIEIQ